MYRHGDLLIKKILEPSGERVIVRWLENPMEIVLLKGEATGHAHRLVIQGKGQLKLYENKAGDRFFEVRGTAKLIHEEHKPIELSDGLYAVIRQMVYTPKAIQYVID